MNGENSLKMRSLFEALIKAIASRIAHYIIAFACFSVCVWICLSEDWQSAWVKILALSASCYITSKIIR